MNLVLRALISHVPEVCFRQMGVLGVQEDDHQRLLQQMASRLTMSDFCMGRGDAQAKSESERRTQAVGKHNRDFPLQQSVQRHVLSLVLANNTACFERSISRVKV